MNEEELLAKIIVRIISKKDEQISEGNKVFLLKNILEAWRAER